MFSGILYPSPVPVRELSDRTFIKDLNLDRLLKELIPDKKDSFILPFYLSPVPDIETALYRQQVFKDLEDGELVSALREFSDRLALLSESLAACRRTLRSEEGIKDSYLSMGRLLGYARRYTAALTGLSELLEAKSLRSQGLRGFSEYLKAYAGSEEYRQLCAAVSALDEKFASLEYCMLIRGGTMRVKKLENEENLSRRVLDTFEKFRQDGGVDYKKKFSEEPAAEHVEAGLLRCLSRLYPEEFSALRDFAVKFLSFEDPVILSFAREIRFYLLWLSFTESIRASGLSLCLPELSMSADGIFVYDTYDIVLARFLGSGTVANDFYLRAPEQMTVISGPNQGGKTTFARAIGQIHYLASLGLSVPGSRARLLFTDSILTHFQRQENIENLSGKLQEELIRLRDLLGRAGPRSLIIINEIFSSTTLSDALTLGRHMMDSIAASGAPALIVSFMEELTEHGEDTVSMLSLSDRNDPSARSYRLRRSPPEGLACALALAEKYSLSYEQLMRRLKK